MIEALSTEWDPDKHKDQYRDRLRKVVDRKRKGATIEIPEPREEPRARSGPDGRARADARRR